MRSPIASALKLRPTRRPRSATPDFFIVGWQKSGSTWLAAILNAHPDIRCFPSLPQQAGGDGSPPAHFFDVLARLERDFPSFQSSMSNKLGGYFSPSVPEHAPRGERGRRRLRRELRDRFVEYLEEQRELHGKPVVGEKTAETVHHLDLVEELFPGVRKVCILRDPRDRTVSFHYQEIRKGRRPDGPVTASVAEEYLDLYLRRDYAGALQIEEPRFILTYEQLASEPKPVVTALLSFLDATAGTETVHAMLDAADFQRLADRERGAEDAASYYRKGVVGDWREKMPPEVAELIMAELEPQTARLEERFGLDLTAYRGL